MPSAPSLPVRLRSIRILLFVCIGLIGLYVFGSLFFSRQNAIMVQFPILFHISLKWQYMIYRLIKHIPLLLIALNLIITFPFIRIWLTSRPRTWLFFLTHLVILLLLGSLFLVQTVQLALVSQGLYLSQQKSHWVQLILGLDAGNEALLFSVFLVHIVSYWYAYRRTVSVSPEAPARVDGSVR
jgi:hypothetical protein